MHQSGLIWAAKRNNTLMVRMLLKAHSRANFRDLAGRTALTFAVTNDNEEMVRILLCFKADPKIEDNKGQSITSLYFSRENQGNLKIGHHLKLASHQLFRQKFLVEFIHKVRNATATRKNAEDDSNSKALANKAENNNFTSGVAANESVAEAEGR